MPRTTRATGFCFAAALLTLSAAPTAAQQPDGAIDGGPSTTTQPADAPGPASAVETQESTSIDELRRRIDVLAAEVEQLRSGEAAQAELTEERRRALGLAPSAAATYRRATQGVSLAGYGEMLLEHFNDENERGAAGAPSTRLDFLRAVLYAGYRFNDRFLVNSEIELEHGGEEVGVEFAYIDYLVNDRLTLRGGMVLIPLGLVNEFHEPNVFLGTRRPETERRIIPSTWHENGAGLLASVGRLNVRAYITNGFKAESFTSAGLRGGRQGGVEAVADRPAFSGRLDVAPVPGIVGGIGLYTGNSGQAALGDLEVQTTIVEGHAQAQVRGIDFRALFAHAGVDNAGQASRAIGLAVETPVAETMHGGYVQAGYNVLSQYGTALALTPYVRYERVNTQSRIPQGFREDLARDGTFTTLGVELKPIPNVAIKADYQRVTNAARTGRGQFNVSLGYAF
ncbi:MAG: hypothetical protein HY824_12050 [Acidobacteria bacterium]|nr:hypothetical protein [Acidobacteriota bacterium]